MDIGLVLFSHLPLDNAFMLFVPHFCFHFSISLAALSQVVSLYNEAVQVRVYPGERVFPLGKFGRDKLGGSLVDTLFEVVPHFFR